MNKTTRTFVLVGLVVAILLALHFLPTPQIGDTTLRPVDILSDVTSETQESLETAEAPESPEAPDNQETTETPEAPDNQEAQETPVIQDTPAALSDSIVPIEDYAPGGLGGMAHFYAQLKRVGTLGRPVRIGYYGDSFIEGDILTSDIREMLQDRFGGNGVGWVDCGSKVHGFRQTVTHQYGGFSEHEVVSHPFNGDLQSISQRYFLPTGTPKLTLTGTSRRRHVGQWQRSTFFLRTNGGCMLTAKVKDCDSLYIYNVEGSPLVQSVTCEVDTMATASIEWQATHCGSGTTLFGVALEDRQGIVVDNFSMRGSAGFTIANIPATTLRQFAAIRPYDLFVIQFGLNVANARQTNYRTYIDRMGRAIDHLREAYPTASILVVGCPDRDQRTAQGIKTMNGIQQLLSYQRLMANEHGVAFLSLFDVMGGPGGMKRLVDRGLANKDYTHLNFGGGREIATHVVASLMAGYEASSK